jgi:hypothetical protein
VLLNSAFLIASREGRNEIINDDIDAASKQISKDRLSDLIKEYEVVFPGIKLIIDIFKNRPAFDNYLSLEKFIDSRIENNSYDDIGASDFAILGTGKEVFFALYSIGFVGLREPTSGKLIFCHDGSPATPSQLDKNQVTCIHPCYWKALDITEQTMEEAVLNDIYDEYEIKNNPEVQDQRTRRIGQLVSILPCMKIGQEESSKFEDWVFQTVRILFSGNLSNPEQKPNLNAIQRRDIVATNQGTSSFWSRIINDYNSRQIIFECKNYEDMTLEDYRQALSYTSGVYGKFIILVNRSQNEGLTSKERGWVKEFYDKHDVLIFTVPANTLLRCVRKIRNAKRHDYTDETLNKRLDTYERSYLSLRHFK